MSGESWLIKDERELNLFIDEMVRRFKEGSLPISVEIASGKQALSRAQQNSIWLWCSLIASELSKHEVSMVQLLASMRRSADIYPTKDSVREFIWKPVQKAITGKQSMTYLERTELDQIIDPIAKFLGESHYLDVAFPSKEHFR